MTSLELRPVDTLFFRSGMAFEAGDMSAGDAGGPFPPPSPTVVGSLRAALARTKGWSGHGPWSEALKPVLGDGPEELGALCFAGPFLLRAGEPLFACPRHVVGKVQGERWIPHALLRPGPPVSCDLGEHVRLPEAPPASDGEVAWRTGDGWWLTQAGVEAVLRGEVPSARETVSSRELWCEERRIGLRRSRETRTAEEGLLFSTRHVRPHAELSLGMAVDGLPADWDFPWGECLPLGGESRMVECRRWERAPRLPVPWEDIRKTGRFTLLAVTPLRVDRELLRAGGPRKELGGARVISACVNRPERPGGWSTLDNRPVRQRSVLPPGSVLFCQADDPTGVEATLCDGRGLCRLGEGGKLGFGVVAVGAWREEESR